MKSAIIWILYSIFCYWFIVTYAEGQREKGIEEGRKQFREELIIEIQKKDNIRFDDSILSKVGQPNTAIIYVTDKEKR